MSGPGGVDMRRVRASRRLAPGALLAVLGCATTPNSGGMGDSSVTDVAQTTSSGDSTGTSATSGGESDGVVDTSGTSSCAPPGGEPSTETITVETMDGKQIAGTLAAPAAGTCLPAVLLVHQYLSDRTEWDALQGTLVEAGYVTLAIDLRGHGESDPQDGDISGLLTDPLQAPLDVAAGLGLLSQAPQVDPGRIGVVGASVGANLSVVAMHRGETNVAVALSPRTDPILALAEVSDAVAVDNLYCLAGENDGGGDQAASCTALADQATGSGNAVIIPSSSAHGTALLERSPELVSDILEWLAAAL